MSESLPSPSNLAFVEELHDRFLADPESVDPSWRAYFQAWTNGHDPTWSPGPSFRAPGLFVAGGRGDRGALDLLARQQIVDRLVRAYRVRGHLHAALDPLGFPRPPQPELDPAFYGLVGDESLNRRVSPSTLAVELNQPPMLAEILDRLRNTYCRSIGVQFMHIDELRPKDWLQERMERTENRLALDRATQVRILTKLTDAVVFEEFIQKQYLGAKRFSLEGGESLVPLLDLAIERAGEHDIGHVVVGMAHRGRINVLANTLGKPASKIFHEFDDRHPELLMGRGDVKYHLGYNSKVTTTSGRTVNLSLCFNPSHLEFVSPVALGRVRAFQDRYYEGRHTAMALLVHGDASFAGQGVTQETLNLSQLHGYATGGAIHVIINNQVGFTTPPTEGRSTEYATAVAKMLSSPIFHVNGEDPEAVAQVVQLAMDFRQEFRRDVVIDMYCYRRYGHNEGDEPAFTQPLMYEVIRKRKSVRQAYLEYLLDMGEVTEEAADELREASRLRLEQELHEARQDDYEPPVTPQGEFWADYTGGPESDVPQLADTGLAEDEAKRLLHATTVWPEHFEPHPKIVRILEERREMAKGNRPLNWAAGEALAFASLVDSGTRVRFTGQDTPRGTFSHRHAVLFDHRNGSGCCPIRELGSSKEGGGVFEIYNSPLSEIGVLGFEYGYSLDAPDALVLWEAQFGDFHNVAQVIIDQFLASAEDKWNRLSGLVLLLPHGFEGMGPEHSSARLERFLTLAAEDNMQIANVTTPAQYYHLLRRQVLRPWRKPLVVMTPKSLLRHPKAISTLEDVHAGTTFRRIIPDGDVDPKGVRRIVLCSGKVYYELLAARDEREREDVALVRFEQLYPLSDEEILEALSPYPDGIDIVWVQEEPQNAGAWAHYRLRFGETLLGRGPFSGVSRPESASPATGSASSHRMEQEMLVDAALGEASS